MSCFTKCENVNCRFFSAFLSTNLRDDLSFPQHLTKAWRKETWRRFTVEAFLKVLRVTQAACVWLPLQALSATDLNLVLYVCETIEAQQVFGQHSCPLSQPVLLSLIQQLSSNLATRSELKIGWDHLSFCFEAWTLYHTFENRCTESVGSLLSACAATWRMLWWIWTTMTRWPETTWPLCWPRFDRSCLPSCSTTPTAPSARRRAASWWCCRASSASSLVPKVQPCRHHRVANI